MVNVCSRTDGQEEECITRSTIEDEIKSPPPPGLDYATNYATRKDAGY
jgi:hypothetical protein